MKTQATVPFRKIAADHLSKAKNLLKQGRDQEVYACLELRLAIEALVYELLQTYSEDVSEEISVAFGEWHPRVVLDHLLAHDPFADRPLRIVLRAQPVYENGSRGEMIFVDEIEDRFDAKWASKAYAALSSFLHQPTIAHRRKGAAINRQKLHKKAQEIVDRLDQIITSKVTDVRLGLRFGYSCPACGGDLSVAILPLMTGTAQTSCLACSAAWDVSRGEGGMPNFSRRTEKS